MHRAHHRYLANTEDDTSALVERHAALIGRVARRLAARTGCPDALDDLWSAGAMGLIEAARRFDPARHVRFESFAEHRIRGAMLDELRRLDHLPRRLRMRTERLVRVREKLERSLGREPRQDELAAAMGLPLEEVATLELLEQPILPLAQEPAAPGSPLDDSARKELLAALTSALQGLPERLQTLLALHYLEGLTYRELARVLGVSEPRVSQLHADAVARLRAMLAGAGYSL